MLIHGESSHSRWWLQSLGPLTLPTKRRGIPRTQSLHGRDGHHLGFPVMSSPKSAMSVPPPVKKRRMWSLGEKMVLNCAQASSSPPQHTVFCGLRTAIPQVEVQETQPPQRECGLMVTSTRRLCPCWHLARRMRISSECVMALHQWRNPCVFQTGVLLRSESLRKVVTMDTSLMGWGYVFRADR